MTTPQENGREILKKIYEDKKEFCKKYEIIFEDRMKTAKVGDIPQAKAHHALAFFTFRSLVDVYDSLEKISLTVSESLENVDKRLAEIERAVKELGGQINNDNIVAVAKFAEEFRKQIEESRKSAEAYKRKMVDNDLAT